MRGGGARRVGLGVLIALLIGALAPVAAQAVPPVTGAASAVGWNTATLDGSVPPPIDGTSWFFEFGTSTPPPDDLATSSTPFSGAGPVRERISGLPPGTLHHFRLVSDDGLNPVETGADATFTTRAEDPPAVLAAALADVASQVTGAAWVTKGGTPTTTASGVLAAPLSGFPLSGPSAALLTTGAADPRGHGERQPERHRSSRGGRRGRAAGPAPSTRASCAIDLVRTRRRTLPVDRVPVPVRGVPGVRRLDVQRRVHRRARREHLDDERRGDQRAPGTSRSDRADGR